MFPKYKAIAEKWTEIYKNHPDTKDISVEDLRNEIAFKITKELIDNPADFNAMVAKDLTLAERIRLWLRNFLNRLMKTNFTAEQQAVKKALNALETAIKEGGNVEQSGDISTSPAIEGYKFSIKELPDGKRKYVKYEDKGIIKGTTYEGMRHSVAEYLRKHFLNKYVTAADGDKLYITQRSIEKSTDYWQEVPAQRIDQMTETEKAQLRQNYDGNYYEKMSLDNYKQKLRAVTLIHQLAYISKAQKNPDGGKKIVPSYKAKSDYWEYGQDGFSYRDSYFLDDDNQYYYAPISVTHDGEIEGIYNIKLYKRNFPVDLQSAGKNNSSRSAEKRDIRDSKHSLGTTIIRTSQENSQGLSQKIQTTDKKFSLPDTDSKGRKLTEAQREFFKDSKVVDEKGRLIEVYHGTNADFNVFSQRGTDNKYGKGFYFSEYKEFARLYGDKLLSVYLDIKKPIVVGKGDYKKLGKYGYDGIIQYKNGKIAEAVVLNPNQIKLTTNLNPTTNEDIRYSLPISKQEYGTKPPKVRRLAVAKKPKLLNMLNPCN